MAISFLSSDVLPSVSVCVKISSSYGDISYTELGPNHMTSFYFNYLFKGPISKYSHILRYGESELQQEFVGGAHNSAHNTWSAVNTIFWS